MKKYLNFLTKTKAKAFTLIEMLVVLVIISVLLLLFVPNLTKQKKKSHRLETLLSSRLLRVKQSFTISTTRIRQPLLS